MIPTDMEAHPAREWPVNRPGRRGHSPVFRSRVVAAIVRGCKVRDVAALYRVSKGSIWIWCRAAGFGGRNIGDPPTCHPGRPHYGRGLCRQCYRAEWDRNGHVTGPRRKSVLTASADR